MRSVFAWVCLLILVVSTRLNAQITLLSSSFPADVIGCDSLKITTYNTTLPSFLPASDGVWDLTAITDSNINLIESRKPDDTYQYADSNQYYIAGNLSYLGYLQSAITTVGLQEFGLKIPQRIYCLGYVTSDNYDSLYIDSQTVNYSFPLTKLRFPTDYLSCWSSNYHCDLALHATISIGGMNYAAGKVRKYVTETDSVIGWGKMRVNDETGNPSAFFDVLQIQSTITTIDSVLMDSTFNNIIMLPILHLSQGQKDTEHIQYFYNIGDVTPLAKVAFNNNNISTPKNIITHVHLSMNDVPNIKSYGSNLALYPNPVTDKLCNIKLPHKGYWKFELINEAGIIISTHKVNKSICEEEFHIPNEICKGVYYIKSTDENGNIYSNGILVDR